MIAGDASVSTAGSRTRLRSALLTGTAFAALSLSATVGDTGDGMTAPVVSLVPLAGWVPYAMRLDWLAWLLVVSPLVFVVGIVLLVIASA